MANKRIFVNYRRDDSASHALNLAQYLEATFGRRNVFLDIDRMRAGQSFPTVLKERLQASKVMLAVIGPQWLELRNDQGQRRIVDAADWVRLEIATALQSGVVVIPVLVGGAGLPRKADLPPDLQTLVDQHAVTITTNGFRNEMAGLVRDIRAIPGPKPWGTISGVTAAGLALALGGWALAYQQGVPVWVPWQPQERVDPKAEETRRVAAAAEAKDAADAEVKLAVEQKARSDVEARAKQLADVAEKVRLEQETALKKTEDARARVEAEAEEMQRRRELENTNQQPDVGQKRQEKDSERQRIAMQAATSKSLAIVFPADFDGCAFKTVNRGIQTVAIVVSANPTAKSAAADVRAAAERSSFDVVAEISLPDKGLDFAAPLTLVRRANPGVVFACASNAHIFLQQAQALGLTK